jgi:CheY-like chemotaxis protein
MKVLIAEDDPVSQRVLEGFLTKWGYELVITQDGEEAWQALAQEDAPQLAILDWMMPRMDGLEVCRRVRERNAEPYVYILLLTAKGQKQDVAEGINAGADDYLSKPFDAGELQARLRSGRRILALQGALISARDALRFQATHDPLTGLWNRLAATGARTRPRQAAAVVRRRSPGGSGSLQDHQRHLRPLGRRCRAARSSEKNAVQRPRLRYGGSIRRRGIPVCAPRLRHGRGARAGRKAPPGLRPGTAGLARRTHSADAQSGCGER